jgi:integrase
MTLSKLGEGLEDRKDRASIRARVRRDDIRGVRRDLSQTFPYERGSSKSRSAAIALAKAWVAEHQRALRFDRVPAGERPQDQTVGDWVVRYIEEATHGLQELREAEKAKEAGRKREATFHVPAHARKKGIEQELSVLRSWHAEFPNLMARKVHEVTRQHLDDVVDHLRYHRVDTHGTPIRLKPVTIRRWLQVLSAVYNTAAKDRNWGFRDVLNPIRGMDMPQASNPEEAERKGRVVTAEELCLILAMIPETSLATRCCIRFLRWTGARRSEALKLDWSDVILDADIPKATFRDTKNPRGLVQDRTIPLDRHAVDALNDLLDGNAKPSKGRVFPLSKDTPSQAWMRGRDRASLDVRLHDMRHTRTTEITKHLPAIEAQAITGHKDIRMLLRYYHASADELGAKLRDAMNAEAKRKEPKRESTMDSEFQVILQIAEAIGIDKLIALKSILDNRQLDPGG